MKRSQAVLFFAGLILILGGIIVPWWGAGVHQATGAASKMGERVVAEGRLKACSDALVTVRSEYAEVIEAYPAREDQLVQKGELLASLRSTDVEARLSEAKASLSVDDARLSLAKNRFHRARRLWRNRATSFATYDRARKTLEMVRAQKERSLADVSLYQSILSKTKIYAPISGTVVGRYHNLGEYVKVGTRIATVADLSRTRVEAEVDEFDIGRVHVGAPAELRPEGMKRTFHGVVAAIAERVTRKRLVPDDPSRPTDTGVVLVKIVSGDPLPFKLGQKVDVRIETGRSVSLPGDSEKTHCSGS